MLDIKFIRENKDIVQSGAQKKNIQIDIEKLIVLDDERLATLKLIEDLTVLLNKAFTELTDDDLNKTYPYDFMGTNTTGFYLTRFLCHLSYHLGQVNYHRRLLDI